MTIPHWTFKEFKIKMMLYREVSKRWENSSYLPRDCIYLQSCYRQLFQLELPTFSKEDIEYLSEIYSKLI